MKLTEAFYWEPGMPLPAPPEVLNAGKGMCCVAAAEGGPLECICWKPVYDTAQQRLRPGAPMPESPPRMCGDCAYRPQSPERAADPAYQGDSEFLRRIAADGEPFFVHPSGAEIPGSPADYRPPIHGGTPYKADGTAATLCSGWYLFHRRIPEAADHA